MVRDAIQLKENRMAKSKNHSLSQNDQAHLGRNPFDKSRRKESTKVKNPAQESEDGLPPASSASEWLFVRLPADTMVFAIKTAMLMKESLTRKRS
jgi:hypothetical protein